MTANMLFSVYRCVPVCMMHLMHYRPAATHAVTPHSSHMYEHGARASGPPPLAAGTPLHVAMASCPRGTLCVYCGVRIHAGYRPDGASGPMCMGNEDDCYEVAQKLRWDVVVNRRLKRLWRGMIAKLARRGQPCPLLSNWETETLIASFLWHAHA